MNKLALSWLIASLISLTSPALGDDSCVVASVQPLATEAGLAAYRSGGNAVDAAIATALTLGVVDNHNSGLGGGCFILIRDPDGNITAIDGREMAPQAATEDMYVRNGKADPELSTVGPLAVGVPGALAAYDMAIRWKGQLTLEQLLRPAATLARQGFEIDRIYASKLSSKASDLSKFSASAAALLKADGTPYSAGEKLVQPDLANTYQNIADHGVDWFYRGPFAESVGNWMSQNGGILTAKDFALYQPKVRTPVISRYRNWQIVGFPPPSSGGVHVAQMLNILEHFDLREQHRRDPAQAKHLVAEAMKLAFADRAHWLGDADFADVPRGLTDRSYAAELAKRIDVTRSSNVPSHSNPPDAKRRLFSRHTTHIAAADDEGYWVAITATVNTTFGSKVIVPGTGLILNNEMDDFSAQPGVPNRYGLVGAENNAIAPGKRPLSSMSPSIVLSDGGEPLMTVGAAGGPKIITQVLLAIIRSLDYELPLDRAVGDPRFHHQWKPDQLMVEENLEPRVMARLEDLGHEIKTITSGGVCQAIQRLPDGEWIGVSDPRVPGKAAVTIRPTKNTN